MRERTPLRSAVVTATVVLVLLAADYGARHFEGTLARSYKDVSSTSVRTQRVAARIPVHLRAGSRQDLDGDDRHERPHPRGSVTFSDVHLLLRNLRFSVRDLFDR